MQEYDNFTSNTSQEGRKLMSLNQCSDSNNMINNERKEDTWETCYGKKKKRKNKKVAPPRVLQVKAVCTDVKANNSNNKSSTLHLANNENISNDSKLSKAIDTSNTNTVKYNNVRDTSDKNTSTSNLKKDSLQTHDTKEKKDEMVFLRKDNVQTNIIINNSIDKALLFANKEDNDSILSKTADLSNTGVVEYNNGDNSDKDIFTLQNPTHGDTQKTFLGKKNRVNNKKRQLLRKKNAPTDIQMDNSNNKAHTSQFVNNEYYNNLPSTSTAKVKNFDNTSDKDTSAVTQNSKFIFFDVDYEFHEANHAIIDTFAINIYFSLCSDTRETFCLVCDETIQLQNKDRLPEQVVQFLIMSKENAAVLLERSNHVCHNETINHVLYNLITDLRRFLPHVKAYPFGSRISDLGFPNSDIDIFLDCDNMYEGRNSTRRHCQTLIVMVAYYLSFNKQSWKVHEVILHSRTPIAKVQHVLSGLTCDISVTNGLAVENTKIIKCFNRAFPLCRKMILFLKRWLHFCGLLGSRLVTSYAITWCVIFYLQTLLVFPNISELVKLKNKSWRISGWEVGISYDFPIRKIDHTFEELLLGFFIFYTDFNFKNHVVCPLLGQPIEKNAFTNLSNLPQDMIPYINYMQNTSTEEEPQAFSISSLCVQDPFDLSHNLTKAVSNCKLKKFQTYCNYSAKILKKTIPYLKPPS
ncbi:speckle targeted PIP5K1A-regulated poly(A) polymerase-like isoform X4 [Linepithema humile]|uniref:speckle targeted PIP5K1A-regulated poly(A) polymerase-like isoform X4 n=1 Tax=Linepithema humile TaxID=83485 RepID=UPI00351DAEEC